MKRIYRPYNVCEEYAAGMWRNVSGPDRIRYIKSAAALMKDPQAFRDAMRRAIKTWRYSCQHNLTCTAMNRIAWLGHAGCCIELGSPEDITRFAWWTLNLEEQDAANLVAAEVLAEWEAFHLAEEDHA